MKSKFLKNISIKRLKEKEEAFKLHDVNFKKEVGFLDKMKSNEDKYYEVIDPFASYLNIIDTYNNLYRRQMRDVLESSYFSTSYIGEN